MIYSGSVFSTEQKLLPDPLTLDISGSFVCDSAGPSCDSAKARAENQNSQQHAQIARKPQISSFPYHKFFKKTNCTDVNSLHALPAISFSPVFAYKIIIRHDLDWHNVDMLGLLTQIQ